VDVFVLNERSCYSADAQVGLLLPARASPACLAAVSTPARTVLGPVQKQALKDALLASTAAFEVIVNDHRGFSRLFHHRSPVPGRRLADVRLRVRKVWVGDAWRGKGGVRWLAVIVGAVVPVFASLALTDTFDLLYQLSGEPFGASFYRDEGRPTEVGLIVGTTIASRATFLAFLGGTYVAGKVVGSFGGLVGVLVAVLGVLLAGALSSGPLLDTYK
jgi:hypothetical protein